MPNTVTECVQRASIGTDSTSVAGNRNEIGPGVSFYSWRAMSENVADHLEWLGMGIAARCIRLQVALDDAAEVQAHLGMALDKLTGAESVLLRLREAHRDERLDEILGHVQPTWMLIVAARDAARKSLEALDSAAGVPPSAHVESGTSGDLCPCCGAVLDRPGECGACGYFSREET